MSTVSQSLAFEKRVLTLLSSALHAGTLGIIGAHAHIYHQRGYMSWERRAKIKVDVAIEVYRGKAKEPFLIWVWECKNYGHSIPVDDIEEFHAKLQQIGSDRTKGTVIAAAPYQKGAIEYARTHGIGLARLFEQKRLIFDLENTAIPTETDLPGILIEDDPRASTNVVAATTTGLFLRGLATLIATEIAGQQPKILDPKECSWDE